MWIASKTPPEKAKQWVADVRPYLFEGETVLAATTAKLVRPMVLDGLIVTNYRLLGVRGARLAAKGPGVELVLGDVAEVNVASTLTSFNEIQVATHGGKVVRLGDVPKADLGDVRRQVESAVDAYRRSPAPTMRVVSGPLPLVEDEPIEQAAPAQRDPAAAREKAQAAHTTFGRGVRDSSMRSRLDLVRPFLDGAEQALYHVNARSLSPRADALVVTDVRVLALLGSKVVWELTHADTVAVTAADREKGISFTAVRGGARLFKGIDPLDRDVFVAICDSYGELRVPLPPEEAAVVDAAPADAPAATPHVKVVKEPTQPVIEEPGWPAVPPPPRTPPAPEPVAEPEPTPRRAPSPPPPIEPPAELPVAPPPVVEVPVVEVPVPPMVAPAPPVAPRAEPPAPTPAPSPAPTSGTSLADELRKLAALRDEGILSDDEFSAAKRRLIEG